MTTEDDATRWDLVVLGGGTAGLVSAHTAAGLGARVLLVERQRTGGECLWTGCVPSKALLAAAHAAADAQSASRLGVTVDAVRVDFSRVMRHVQDAIAAIEPADSVESLERAGVHVLRGTARFAAEGRIDVEGRTVNYRQALVATGSVPRVPSVRGIETVEFLTSESIWNLSDLPERLVILGGGRVACELGQAFARLGSAVTILERGGRILSGEDDRVAATITGALIADGVDVRTRSSVAAVRPRSDSDGPRRPSGGHTAHGGILSLENGSTLEFDALLVAAGTEPRTADLGLERVGVRLTSRGTVEVDDHMRTTNPRIWAAGDLTGHPHFTHTAGVHASTAATNAVLGPSRKAAVPALEPSVLFTQPEVASVGIRPADAAKNPRLRVLTREHAELDRAVAEGTVDGFTQLVVTSRGTVKGALVVGPRAGETLGELTLAVRKGLSTSDIASATHPYPTYNDAVWNAAIGDLRHRLARPPVATVLGLLTRLRRRLLDRH